MFLKNEFWSPINPFEQPIHSTLINIKCHIKSNIRVKSSLIKNILLGTWTTILLDDTKHYWGLLEYQNSKKWIKLNKLNTLLKKATENSIHFWKKFAKFDAAWDDNCTLYIVQCTLRVICKLKKYVTSMFLLIVLDLRSWEF